MFRAVPVQEWSRAAEGGNLEGPEVVGRLRAEAEAELTECRQITD